MEWTKIPTNLLNGKFEDKEILAIVKYQLLFALYEEEPSDKILNRFLTKRQQLALNRYIVDIKLNVKNEINKVQKKRTNNNLKYAENKEKCKNSDILSDDLSDGCQTEQIRLDKIREDNKEKETNKEKENFSSFKEFWLSCPKKQDEYKAYITYNTILKEKRATADDLLTGIKNYARYVNGKDERFIQTPFNWLTNGKWTDEYEGITYERKYNPFAIVQ